MSNAPRPAGDQSESKRICVSSSRSPYFQVKWTDPQTGKERRRTARTKVRIEAERFAAKLEKEIELGIAVLERTPWREFRKRYEASSRGHSKTSQKTIRTAFNSFEKHCSPRLVQTVNAPMLSDFTSQLRDRNLSEYTIKSYLCHLRAALRWAQRQGYIVRVPAFDMPKRTRGISAMKGRPITREEFRRMEDVALADCGPSWLFLIRGLYWSGLRLSEAMLLQWDCYDEIGVDFSREQPRLRIDSESEKGGRDRLLPVAWEFRELLYTVPEDQRTGFVFKPQGKQPDRPVRHSINISQAITEMGKKAGIVVSTKRGKIKYASAHDFRRAFGLRWAERVMPHQLMLLMRHVDIQTTLGFYVGRNTDEAARLAGTIGYSEEAVAELTNVPPTAEADSVHLGANRLRPSANS